jgi:chemotaxis protein histidine kinase CheA
VGMDAVKAAVEKLSGRRRIESLAGKGTQFFLELPSSVLIVKALVLDVGLPGVTSAVPVGRVESAVSVTDDIYDPNTKTLVSGGRSIPVAHLAALLGGAAMAVHDKTALVCGRGEDACAIVVEGIFGQEELVMKPLQAPLENEPHILGAAVLANGQVAFVLDPLGLAVTRLHNRL